MRAMNNRWGRWLGLLICLSVLAPGAEGRYLVGMQGNLEIHLSTTLKHGGEYVPATDLAGFFPNAFRYDALSGTLLFQRMDGVSVGIKTGDDRVVVDKRVHYTGDPTLREESRIYVPFSVVQTFLFPRVRFEVSEAPPTSQEQELTGLMQEETPTLKPQFSYPTPPPVGMEISTPTPVGFPFPQPTPATLDISMAPSSVIVLDPGNDGRQPGALSPLALRESDLTLAICQKLAVLLQDTKSFEVVLTRVNRGDGPITNEERIGVANAKHGALLVSFQCGGMFSDVNSRAAVFYMNEDLDAPSPEKEAVPAPAGLLIPWHDAYRSHVLESFRLARGLVRELKPFYDLRGIIQIDDMPRPARLALLRGLSMPGVLVELGNLNHSPTARHFASERIQSELAESLERAISNFIYERAGIPRTVGQR